MCAARAPLDRRGPSPRKWNRRSVPSLRITHICVGGVRPGSATSSSMPASTAQRRRRVDRWWLRAVMHEASSRPVRFASAASWRSARRCTDSYPTGRARQGHLRRSTRADAQSSSRPPSDDEWSQRPPPRRWRTGTLAAHPRLRGRPGSALRRARPGRSTPSRSRCAAQLGEITPHATRAPLPPVGWVTKSSGRACTMMALPLGSKAPVGPAESVKFSTVALR